MYRNGGLDEARFTEIDEQLLRDVQMLKEFYNAILEVNEPTVLRQDNRDMLDKINEYRLDVQDEELSIINRNEFDLLCIPKGSLSPIERKEIESRVVHTQNFLSHIPWTREFQNIPAIAAAHHGKLDGSGYPYSMKDEEIPLPSKIMAVCDIYDALTASDRPYKRAMNTEKAIDILMEESGRGLLDRNLVQVFADAKVFRAIGSKEYSTATEFSSFSNHPCDVDEHLHDKANLK